ncbi:hypothetical protein ACIPZF_08645 [Pseudomonas sp. NPDC089752]|uniref:hypothetical protein n=1 Tax=Pseudomonas sp. NPDC089752 TaxID=3364472 RepID=UPI0037F5BA60
MRSTKSREKPMAVARFEAEARRLAGQISSNQLRFLQVAKAKGEELEPSGPLAGNQT